MQSIDDKIFKRIKKCGRGKEYFASDFAVYGETKSISKVLANLVKKQVIILNRFLKIVEQLIK